MSNTDLFVKKLKAILEEDSLIENNFPDFFLKEERDNYLSTPYAVIMPKTIFEVQEIMAIANELKQPLVVQGGNSGTVGGTIASDGEIILSTIKLKHVAEVNKSDYSMTVAAGYALSEVQNIAKKYNLNFTLALPSQDRCLIGGNLATNAGGIQAIKYGSMRDLTLSLKVVLGSGELLELGGNLRKDNFGLDLKNLFIGSEGIFGIICEATLKLFPDNQNIASMIVAFDNLEDLQGLYDNLIYNCYDTIQVCEFFSDFSFDLVRAYGNIKNLPNVKGQYYLWVELTSSFSHEVMIKKLEDVIVSMKNKLSGYVLAFDDSEATIYRCLREAIPKVQKNLGYSIKNDVSVPISKVAELLIEIKNTIPTISKEAITCAFGHVGDGNIHVNFSKPLEYSDSNFKNQADKINGLVNDIVISLGGSIAAEHGVGLLKRELLLKYKAREVDIYRELKKLFDGNNILARGKVI